MLLTSIVEAVHILEKKYKLYLSMPKKRKYLPAPCPICGKEYGTVQFVVFRGDRSNVVCKIGHYDPDLYPPQKKSKTVETNPGIQETITVAIGPRVWHIFRTDLDIKVKLNPSGEIVPITEIFNKGVAGKSKAFGLIPSIASMIKNGGWRQRPDHSSRYRSRRRYHVPEKLSLEEWLEKINKEAERLKGVEAG